MPTLRRRILIYIFNAADLSILAFALYVSVLWNETLTPLSVLAQRRIQVHTIVGIAVVLFFWNIALSLLGLYRSKRLTSRIPEIVDLLKASIAATVLLSFAGLVFGIETITPIVLLRFLSLAIGGLIASRLFMRQSLKVLRRRGHNLRHLLVVGTNSRAVTFTNSIMARPDLGYRLVGFVDNVWVGPAPFSNRKDVVSDIAGFRSYLRNHVIDEVMIALPIKSFYDEEDELLHICQEHGVIVRVLSDFFGESSASSDVAQLGGNQVVSFYTIPNDDLGLSLKRLIDMIASSVLLILFSPVMLLVMVLVRLDSKGPALFAQERIGFNKRRFHIYKFRSMVANAERLQMRLESSNEAQGPVFKIKNDPRITRVGKILRKSSIDELPQLFNVLRGDMSLVGPRPLPVRDYSGFNMDWQRRRFSVRPGITCLWQVSGRSGISFDQWMRLDMQYIDQWSLWLDMKILVRTVPAVLRGLGAA